MNVDDQLIGEFAFLRVQDAINSGLKNLKTPEESNKFCDDVTKALLFTVPEFFTFKLNKILSGVRQRSARVNGFLKEVSDTCPNCVSLIGLLKQLDDNDNALANKQFIRWTDIENGMKNTEYLKVVFRLRKWYEVNSQS